MLELSNKYITSEDKHEVEFDQYFHEYWIEHGRISLSAQFTKTARKRYDPAVLLTYIAAAILNWDKPSWDYDEEDETIKRLTEHLKWGETQHAQNVLLWYMDNEGIDRSYLDKTQNETDKRAREMVDAVIHFLSIHNK